MNRYLLQISIGPVQEFIASARRTRDLWFGSNMLSELSKAAALSVMRNNGRLIFPAADSEDELAQDSPLNVANVILAEFDDVDDPESLRRVSASAHDAAKARLRLYADNAFARIQGLLVKSRWDSQLDDIIEFYSAWTPVEDSYRNARKRVAKLLAARKNIRDFTPNTCTDRVPKSPLDGLLETVFRHKLGRADVAYIEEVYPGIRLKEGEALDAIGLIKRIPGTNDERFAAVSSVAAGDDGDSEQYIAFLAADGDRMGAALSSMSTADEHRNFSRKLSGFALKARDVVVGCQGVCIYTGGDDVMAFLPLNTALTCARRLHDLFAEIMGEFGASLSVGVSIAHAKEDLGLLRKWGHDAEAIAKKGIDGHAAETHADRNGLAVSVRARGNDGFTVREQWTVPQGSSGLAAKSLDERLMWFVDKFMDGQIPSKFLYELRENAAFYDNWTDNESLSAAIKADVIRIFDRKDVALGDDKPLVYDYINERVYDAASMRSFADELIAAQWLCFGIKQGGMNS